MGTGSVVGCVVVVAAVGSSWTEELDHRTAGVVTLRLGVWYGLFGSKMGQEGWQRVGGWKERKELLMRT